LPGVPVTADFDRAKVRNPKGTSPMEYAIKFTDPKGVVSWYPKGFGHTCHEHAADAAKAETFPDERTAAKRLMGYINPPAFWNSERRHSELMRQKFRNWQCDVVPVYYDHGHIVTGSPVA
jgi:hypothetical protein